MRSVTLELDEHFKEVRDFLMPDGLNKRLGLGTKDVTEIAKEIAKNIKENPEAQELKL